MDVSLIEEIKKNSDVKLIKRCCDRILKKFNLKSVRDLGNVSDLVCLLYIFDKYEYAKLVGSLLDEIHFEGNYDIWSNVKDVRFINARILREQGQNDKIEDLLKEVNQQLKPELFQNQADFLNTYDINIINSEKNNYKSEARDWKILKLKMMIQFYEIKEFPLNKEKLNYNIIELKQELKSIVK